jgi:hypothetical protein
VSAFVINSYAFGGGEDPDAAAYLNAVESADTQALEAGVRKAVDDFVKGLKADGIWSAIKACCILAGARTLAGALTPLVGSAPTNVGGNFVSGDYDRKTGLIGDGSTKYLNSNRNNDADPQDNVHAVVWASTAQVGGGGGAYLGAGGFNVTGSINVGADSNGAFFRARTSAIDGSLGSAGATGLVGISRSNASTYNWISGASSNTISRDSQASLSITTYIFARNVSDAIQFPTDGRLAFYSIGESLNLSLLSSRVSTLFTAIGAAI